jgi:hypothetical protein
MLVPPLAPLSSGALPVLLLLRSIGGVQKVSKIVRTATCCSYCYTDSVLDIDFTGDVARLTLENGTSFGPDTWK